MKYKIAFTTDNDYKAIPESIKIEAMIKHGEKVNISSDTVAMIKHKIEMAMTGRNAKCICVLEEVTTLKTVYIEDGGLGEQIK